MQIIHFEFGINGASVIVCIKDNFHLELIDYINNCPVRIDPISSYATYKSLGMMQWISKNQISIAHTWVLISTKVTYSQAWLHHILCFIPSVSYLLAVCHLSDSELHSLQLDYLMVFEE